MKNDEFIKTIKYNGLDINLGLDDAGQTYFIEYEQNGELHTECVGSYIAEYMDYIEYRFGKPELNCDIYETVETTDTQCCPAPNKAFCTNCRKFFNDKDWKDLQERRIKFAEWLKKQNENNIT